MGSATGDVDKGTRTDLSQIDARDVWWGNMLLMDRKAMEMLQKDLGMNGWKVDSTLFGEIRQLHATVIPLRPDYNGWPWGPGARAQRQLKNWEEKLSGEVVVLVVQDTSQQGKNPVLVQPVRKDWLTMDEAHLNDQYIAFQGMPEELMYRTAIIARTGVPPAQPATA